MLTSEQHSTPGEATHWGLETHLVVDGMGLDEDEGGVHEGRGWGRRGGSTLGVGVLLGEDLLDGALDALDGTLEERTETHHVRSSAVD